MRIGRGLAGQTSAIDDMLQAEHRPAGKQSRRRVDPDLEIAENIWSDEALLGLLEQWLVPAIVDSIIGDLLDSGGDEVR
jgi:hypothetical protein